MKFVARLLEMSFMTRTCSFLWSHWFPPVKYIKRSHRTWSCHKLSMTINTRTHILFFLLKKYLEIKKRKIDYKMWSSRQKSQFNKSDIFDEWDFWRFTSKISSRQKSNFGCWPSFGLFPNTKEKRFALLSCTQLEMSPLARKQTSSKPISSRELCTIWFGLF